MRPFSPMLPVMDNLALFRMASEKVSWEAGERTERERGRRRKGGGRKEVLQYFCSPIKPVHSKHQKYLGVDICIITLTVYIII